MEKVSNGVTQVGFGAERWSHFESNRAAQVERTVPLESTLKVAKPGTWWNYEYQNGSVGSVLNAVPNRILESISPIRFVPVKPNR